MKMDRLCDASLETRDGVTCLAPLNPRYGKKPAESAMRAHNVADLATVAPALNTRPRRAGKMVFFDEPIYDDA
jgi:hypothetical protein